MSLSQKAPNSIPKVNVVRVTYEKKKKKKKTI